MYSKNQIQPKGWLIRQVVLISFSFFLVSLYATNSVAQRAWRRMAEQPNTLNVEAGSMEVSTSEFNLGLLNSSQTVAKLEPKSAEGFDFTPSDRLEMRDIDGTYHLGDINFRLKIGDAKEWRDYSSAYKRKDIEPLTPSGNQLASARLNPTFPDDLPLSVVRSWEQVDQDLVLRFTLQNTSDQSIEIGALGIPMIFNNILSGKSLDEAHVENVFFDPYIGAEAGYLQAVRLHGKGPVLLVIPETNGSFEAYRPLNDDPTPKGITFEGFHEWMIHSKAYAEKEWAEADPWNKPTSKTLAPGASVEYALKFVTAPDVKQVEEKLIEKKRPVAVGVPGYVLPMDVEGKLFINSPTAVKAMEVSPEGAITISKSGETPNGWTEYLVKGVNWGRARLMLTYEDGLIQTINYKVIKSEENVIEDFGNFLLTEQWYDNENDPFNRGQSVISYDYEKKEQVVQDSRAWIAGLGDEGGAGSWLAAMMKEQVQPDPAEIEKLKKFVHGTLWGGLQYSEGPNKYGVRKSMYYYEPDKMPEGTYSEDVNYNTWAAWDQEQAESTGRSYNYPHVAAAHWVMYRLARYHKGLVTDYDWEWYLDKSYNTAMAMVEQAPHYAQYGQMEGTVFVMLLKDLKREGLSTMAEKLEAAMRKRAEVWKSLNYPFGSEMPWDSTGQEEVYMWSKYFGYVAKADITLNAILAYMPTVPHWGYNGSARRYWDFLYGGKLSRVERQLHHYGSGLNAIPVLSEYREHPEDFYLLRVGYGGLMGSIANITEDGFGPAAFHSYPSTLEIDGLSGDYGTGFLGYALNSSAYLYQHEEFGWLGFGGNIKKQDANVTIELTTAAKSRVYLEPLGLWLTTDAGKITTVTYNEESDHVAVIFAPRTDFTRIAYLQLEQPTSVQGVGTYTLPGGKTALGAYKIKLGKGTTTVTLKEK